jgi:hypothetical protein
MRKTDPMTPKDIATGASAANQKSVAETPTEKLAPCRVREDGAPEFDGTRWESGMHLMGDLVMERLPEPCWIRNGRSAMKIGIGESRIMGRGIMLGYEVTEFSGNDNPA